MLDQRRTTEDEGMKALALIARKSVPKAKTLCIALVFVVFVFACALVRF